MELSETLLEQEMTQYKKNCEDWCKRYGIGKVIVLFKDRMIGPYDNEVTAYQQGIANFGLEPFLIQQLMPTNPIEQVPALVLGVLHANP